MAEPIADDPAGKVFASMLAAIVQFETDAKSDRTKAGMKAALERGRWPFQAPLGYLNGGGTELLAQDLVRGPLVKVAFEECGTGRQTKTEVLRRITAIGLRIHAGEPLPAVVIRILLRPPSAIRR